MSFTDLLTISMPVYERIDFFREALDSALNQTVKCKVIVIDNCSSHDFYEKVCKEKNVTYYRNDRNIGMAANFAKGFELAETKYVMNLQDDDRLSPEYVESFVKAIEEYPDLDIFFSNFLRITADGEQPHGHTLPFGYMENGQKIIEYGIKYKLGYPYIASCIKRTIIHAFHGEYKGSGSYDWVWVYSEADKFSFYGDPRTLYHFRDHDMQDTKINSIRYSLTIPYIYEKVLLGKVTDLKLKKIALKHAFWDLIRLKSVAKRKVLRDIVEEDNIYAHYLNDKIERSLLVRLIFILPRGFVSFCFKVIRKIGIIS